MNFTTDLVGMTLTAAVKSLEAAEIAYRTEHIEPFNNKSSSFLTKLQEKEIRKKEIRIIRQKEDASGLLILTTCEIME